MRSSWTVLSNPARSSRRRAEVAPPSTRSTISAARRSHGPKTPAAADTGAADAAFSGGRPPVLGKVAHVGQHPDRQLRPPHQPGAGQHEDQAQARDRAEDGAPHRQLMTDQTHDRIRRSFGSRPIRIISA